MKYIEIPATGDTIDFAHFDEDALNEMGDIQFSALHQGEAEELVDHYNAQLRVYGKHAVCFRCDGEGVHDNANFNGFTASELNEANPDFIEAYMEGAYSVTCSECNGRNVVVEPQQDMNPPLVWAAYQSYLNSLAETRHIEWQERMYASAYGLGY